MFRAPDASNSNLCVRNSGENIFDVSIWKEKIDSMDGVHAIHGLHGVHGSMRSVEFVDSMELIGSMHCFSTSSWKLAEGSKFVFASSGRKKARLINFGGNNLHSFVREMWHSLHQNMGFG